MKGIIIEGGFLQVERKGKLKDQMCPYNNNELTCGDYCPMFGEPELFSGCTVPLVNLYCGKGSVIPITKDERK